jgi:hypothetical protein
MSIVALIRQLHDSLAQARESTSSRRREPRKEATGINLLEREAQRRRDGQPPPAQPQEAEVVLGECPICLEQVTEFVTWRGTNMCATCKRSLSADDPTLIRPKNRER